MCSLALASENSLKNKTKDEKMTKYRDRRLIKIDILDMRYCKPLPAGHALEEGYGST
jgi:hypothetical protein